MDQLAPDQNLGLRRGGGCQCDFRYGILLYAQIHPGRVSTDSASCLRSFPARQPTRNGLPLLPHRCRKIFPLERSGNADLHELPHADQIPESKISPHPRILENRQSRPLGPDSQSSGLRLLQPCGSRKPRCQLRRLPRSGQPHGSRLPCQTPQHGLVSRVPSSPAKSSSSSRPDHQLGLETSCRHHAAGTRRKIRPRLECKSSRQLQRVPSLNPT